MKHRVVFAIHWHQKQKNAHRPDALLQSFEDFYEAVFTMLQIAEEHGTSPADLNCVSADDLDALSEIDVGPFLLRLLRSDEWYVSKTGYTDEAERDGEVEFSLVDELAGDVKERNVCLVRLRYDAEIIDE